MENHQAGETFMLAPTFSLAPQCPSQFFHSKIATGVTQQKNVMKKISIFFDEECVKFSS